MTSVIRLYVDHPLGAGQSVPLTRKQSHYLFTVMRKGLGERLQIFNGTDGEWLAEVSNSSKKAGYLQCEKRSKQQLLPPDLWLMFAPLKKSRSELVVEKATEMGAQKIMPVKTDFTNFDHIRKERLQSQAVEAAEQCGGTYVPEIPELQKLTKVLSNWDERKIMFCDETISGKSISLPNIEAPWAILVGPEGGFSAREREMLMDMPQVERVTLGPRILRAETAAVAALTLWQFTMGDWT